MYIYHTKNQDLFSTYQIENCCANADRLGFGVLLYIDKSRQITLRFFPFMKHFKGVFPTKKKKKSISALILDTFKRVCEDFLFQSRNFLN